MAMAAKVSAVAASLACPPRVSGEAGRHESVAHRNWDQVRDSQGGSLTVGELQHPHREGSLLRMRSKRCHTAT
jgi:hypothetical protein